MLDDIHFSLDHPSSFFQLLAPPANVISRIDGQVVTDTPANDPRRDPPRDGRSMVGDHGTTRDDLRQFSCCTLGCAMQLNCQAVEASNKSIRHSKDL